jgi:hypothetical protein
MQRKALLKHLKIHGCALVREGANHSVFVNREEKEGIDDSKAP